MAIEVTQVRSSIGCKPKQRGTLRALGLRGIGRSNVLPDRPEIRGMIARVPHLVTVAETDEPAGSEAKAEAPSASPAKKAVKKGPAKKAAAKKAVAKKKAAAKKAVAKKKAAAKKPAEKPAEMPAAEKKAQQ